MSTLKVTTIQDASGGNTATINSMTPTADSLQGFRNRIINGDMRIAQRGTAAVTANDGFPVDRFKYQLSGSGTISSEQSTDAPNGFINSLKFTVTTADSSISSTEFYQFAQFIEGSNISDVGLGQSWCKTLVLSFWVKASQTGTYSVQLAADGGNTCYPTTVTVNSANTWEYKTISIAAITSGTFLTTTGVGLAIRFGFAYGSNFTGATTSTWGTFSGFTNSFVAPTNNMLATLNSTFYITGVQLEVGSVAAPFERRDYGRELMLCQRYYQKLNGSLATYSATGEANANFYRHLVQMRSAPTVTVTTSPAYTNASSLTNDENSVTGSRFYVIVTATGRAFATDFVYACSSEL